MAQNSSKIQGKFYPLTPELAKKLRGAKLTAAEWRFWAYLVEMDPYGDRYHDLDPLTIQTECEISKPTYYRAKAKFQELEIFDFQEEKVSFRNLTGVSKMRLEFQKRDSKSQKRDSKSQKREKQPPKPSPDKGSSSSQRSKTYSDFIQTLSESERESFLEFGKKKAAKLPNPPELILKWVEKHWEEIAKDWRKSRGEKFIPQSQWEIDPRTSEWLAICEETKNPLEFAIGDKEKLDFVKWANINNKFSWLQEREVTS